MQKHTHKSKTECEHCKNRVPFRMPAQLVEACLNKKLVIFAGAGVSTESRLVYPYSFYEDLKSESKIKGNPDFSVLTEKYTSQPDGKRKLLRKIKERLEYTESFPELYRIATNFHRELSTIYFIDEIITTNWDDYFEKECKALPIVTSDDFALWDMPGRKVYKIHGSINNIGSIVCTATEYSKNYKKLSKGLMGSNLKLLLTTKTIVFIGYSFSDSDFNKIYGILRKEMKDSLPNIYVVTLNPNNNKLPKNSNLSVINTDGTYFLEELKALLIKKNLLLPDEVFDDIYEILSAITFVHNSFTSKLPLKVRPETIYLASYQDGLIHAFERILSSKKSGRYSHDHDIINLIISYQKIRNEKLKRHKYHDVAYIDGYTIGLKYLLANKELRVTLPIFYVFGYKKNIKDQQEYLKISANANKLHKASYIYAQNTVKNLEFDGMVYHHSPFLL